MARDSGHRVSSRVFPPGIKLWQELEIEDPLTHGKGWVYLLFSESDPPPLSDEDYISYAPVHQCDPEGDCQLIKGKYFECHYYPLKPYFDTSKYPNIGFAHRHYSLTPEAGGTGVDFSDRLKVRGTLAFFFGLFKFRFDETNMNVFELSYKDGPVRLIRNNQIIVNLPLGLKAPGAAGNLTWYDTILNVPMILDAPLNPGYLYTYLELSIGEDYAPGALGMKIYNSNNLKGCLVDGKTEGEAEINWNQERDKWRLITGKQGTMMNRSLWDENFLEQVKWTRVEYFDDITEEDVPEDDPGMMGMIRQSNRVEGIRKGRYYTYLEWYYPPSFLMSGPGQSYQVGDEKVYLNIADHPIRLRVGEISMENRYYGQMPEYERAERILKK